MARTLRYFRRRWPVLLVIAVVLCAGVVAVLAVAQRDNLFMTLFDPGQPFQVWEPPPAPDYSRPEAWALLPELPPERVLEPPPSLVSAEPLEPAPLEPLADEDATPEPAAEPETAEPLPPAPDLRSDEPEADPGDDIGAAVFFLHPTTYPGGGYWNAPIDKDLSRRAVDRVMIPNYAGPFEEIGPVFAPYYRQSSLFAMLTARDDARRSRALAYEDVDRAFREFLERIGDERAILLVGVGQGALHASRLLQDYVAGDEEMRERLIAAWLIDYPLPEALLDGALAPLPVCRRDTDYRCVIAWSSTEAEQEKRVRYLTQTAMAWDGRELASIGGRPLLCVNPLLWNTSEDFAPARRNLGAVDAEGLEPGVKPSPAPGQTSAECQDGVLLIEKARSERFRRPIALAERYRVAPYNLFYEDVRANARVRADGALARMADEARYADPIEETVVIDDAPVHRVPD